MNTFIQQVLIQIGLLLVYSLLYFTIRRNVLYTLISIMLGVTTYFLVLVLVKNEFGIAAGLGLFAIFGILRYRTESIAIAEMTYIFSVITIAVINAMTDNIVIKLETSLLINAIVIFLSSFLFYILSKTELSKLELHIDNLEWMNKSQEEKLSFLSQKSFFKIENYSIDRIDWLRETCRVVVYYKKLK
jgi:hypothetical protein